MQINCFSESTLPAHVGRISGIKSKQIEQRPRIGSGFVAKAASDGAKAFSRSQKRGHGRGYLKAKTIVSPTCLPTCGVVICGPRGC